MRTAKTTSSSRLSVYISKNLLSGGIFISHGGEHDFNRVSPKQELLFSFYTE